MFIINNHSFKKAYILDLETNGLLSDVNRIHVLCLRDVETNKVTTDIQGNIQKKTLDILNDPEVLLIGHNIIKFDSPVLSKILNINIPWWRLFDTLVMSRLVWGHIRDIDLSKISKGIYEMPQGGLGSHSLSAWGYRLGEHKGDYKGGWESYSIPMRDYCVQDTLVTLKLWQLIVSKEYSERATSMEMQFAHILARQERFGFLFDQRKAVALLGTLMQRKVELEQEVKKVFHDMYLPEGEFTPKKDNPKTGYVAGATMTKIKLTEFNLGSRSHIAHWLTKLYGWKPTEFTPSGEPKVDDEIIGKLPYPEAKPLKDYFIVAKRLGQLSEGKEAWLKAVQKDGRIHGSVNTIGAITGRCTHSGPNMAQVPSGRSPYGHECRELFCVPEGKKLVGADASALELRDLAGYMALYDDGAYIDVVLNGDKANGSDMHSINARALGLDPKEIYFDGESGRDIAKTLFYAWLYGAGDEKIGFILTRQKGQKGIKAGKRARENLLKGLPALKELIENVKYASKERGYLIGLDGRHLHVRSQHAALNTLLQAAGAIQVKMATCIADDDLQALGYTPGIHYELVGHVHDEIQIETNDDIADIVGQTIVNAFRKSGEFFDFKCPLDGEYKVGTNWAETH